MPVNINKKGRVAVLTMEQADQAGLLDAALAYGLVRRCQQIAEDPEVLAAVLTGAGDRFCLGEADEVDAEEGAFVGGPQGPALEAVNALVSLTVPIIAAINGPAGGAGAELALACDIRLAGERASFQFPQLAEGTLPRAGGTQRLPRIVGRAHALELLLLGDRIDAQEAWRMGLVGKVVPQERLLLEAEALAERLAQKAPVAMRYLREAIHKGMDVTLDQGLRLEADLYFLLQTTADRMEGIRSFLEKRTPTFRGE